MRYRSKRTYVWSQAIAYSVGLITSDGCLQKDGRHIDLTSVDIDQLENFCLAIGRPINVTQKFNSSQQPASRVQFSDVAYYDFLLSVGLTPNKSKTMNALRIPDEFYADFLRGVFDGDGTSYAYMDKRWRSSYMFYSGFTSASLAFIKFLQDTNLRLIGTSPASIRIGTRAYNLMYAKADSQKIFNFMYYKQDVLCLARKRIKLEGFIRKNIDDILTEH